MRVEKCTCEEGHMTTPKARMKTHGSQAQRFMKGETCSERPTMPLMITSTSTAAKSSRAAFQSGSDRYHPTGPGRAARPHCSQGLQATANYLSANRAGDAEVDSSSTSDLRRFGALFRERNNVRSLFCTSP